MNQYDLFQAISLLDDKYIEESTGIPAKHSFRFAYALPLAAAITALIVYLPNAGRGAVTEPPVQGADGAGEPAAITEGEIDRTGTYLKFSEGPMLSICISGDTDDIEIARNITFDCSPYKDSWRSMDEIIQEWSEENDEVITDENRQAVLDTFSGMYPEGGDSYYESALLVTDQYELTCDKDKKVQIYVPFISNYPDLQENMPVITVNGEETECSLEPGQNAIQTSDETGMNIENYTDWHSYAELVKNNTYANAGYGNGTIDYGPIPVKIYRIYDVCSDSDSGLVSVNYTKNDDSVVLTYGFHAFMSDKENNQYTTSFAIPNDYTRKDLSEFYIITSGKGLSSFQITSDQPEGTWSYSIEEYDGQLFSIIKQLAEHYLSTPAHRMHHTDPHMFALSIYKDMTERGMLTDSAISRYTGMLEINFQDTLSMKRIMFLRTFIDLKADETAVFTISYKKKGSYNMEPADEWEIAEPSMHSYEMTPQAGTNLQFDQITAGITEFDDITITAGNFGFDIDSGITSVILDPVKEYYYLEIAKKENEAAE